MEQMARNAVDPESGYLRTQRYVLHDRAREYHLTLKGWIAGKVPPSRIITIVRRASLRGGRATAVGDWVEIWKSPQIADSFINEVKAQFPVPPLE